VLLGAVIISIFSWIREMKLKKKIKQLNLKIDELNKNIINLEKEVEGKEEQIKLLYSKERNYPD
jgi:peptidoglycan hydrolase CwlO-like protein